MNTPRTKIISHQKGLVSILVTMFLMIVISLIVIGFAKISRREQRQVLDRQLSTQAFYAAESGVNDAIKALQANPTASNSNCDPAGLSLSGVLDPAKNTAYTCLLVNPAPLSLQYDSIDTVKSTIIPINSTSSPINSIALSWQVSPVPSSGTVSTGCPAAASAGTFQPSASAPANCDAGILRIDLVPTSGTLNRSSLASSSITALLVPTKDGSAATSTFSSGQGVVIAAKCGGASPLCSATINGLSLNSYYVRVRSIYKPNSLSIVAYNGASALPLTGAQATVDSTGKATDVLRRIVVRVKTGPNSDGIPEYAIQSRDSICKRATVGTNFFNPDLGVAGLPGDTAGCNP